MTKAHRSFLKGHYDVALAAYKRLSTEPDRAVAAACAGTDIDLQRGTFDEGLSRLKAVEKQGQNSADWHACKAALEAELGNYDAAITDNLRALELNPNHLRARWQLGSTLEILGRSKEAIKVYAPFNNIMTGSQMPGDAPSLTWLGQGFYRYSVLTRHPNLTDRTKHILTEVYQEAFDSVDPLYWPARLAAAELLLEKHNLAEAKSDFERILKQNDKVPAAHIGLGYIALEDWKFEEVEKHIDAALKIAPDNVEAQLLRAELRMTEERFAEAVQAAAKALMTNPNSMKALSLLAVLQCREGGNKAALALQSQSIDKLCPDLAVCHQIVGQWLSHWRLFKSAESQFKKAATADPTWSEPLAALGQLYMETGDEAQAREKLEAAFALDNFNQYIYEQLQLLDRIDKFHQLETDHFIIKYDESQDDIAAPYFAECLEGLYEDVCKAFNHHPDKKTIIEIFPDHLGFSLRTGGRPFIATIGACTGRVIALTAPHGRRPFGVFNWANVFRHEFTHTVTLSVTNNYIPRWMTEGLAVEQEPTQRSWGNKQLLSDAVRHDKLFTLENINWGFIRPKEANDRALAYAQGEWMMEFLAEYKGPQAVGKLLTAISDGTALPKAFKNSVDIELSVFEKEFKKWAKKQVAAWDLPNANVEEPDDVRKLLKEKPDDASLLARLSQAELFDGDFDAAEETATKALKADEKQPLALETISRILIGKMLSEEDTDKRTEWLKKAEPFIQHLREVDSKNPHGIKFQGYVEQADKRWNQAIALYLDYQKRFPEDPDTYRRLAAIYGTLKNSDAALKQLVQLSTFVENDPWLPRQIAQLEADRGRPAEAVRWYRAALDIDPYDVEIHGSLADSALAAGNTLVAEREYQIVCKILPNHPRGFIGLSKVYKATGNLKEAEAYKKKAEDREKTN